MIRLLTLLLFVGLSAHLWAQCDFSDDYSDASLWTQVGDNVQVSNNRVDFVDGAPGGEQRRIFRELDFNVETTDCWEVKFKFRPEMLGELDGFPMVGHILFALSETDQDPRYDCPDIPCTGNPDNNQDAINIGYYTMNPPNGDVYFLIQCSNTGATLQSERLVYTEINRDIYVHLTRNCGILSLNIFEDEMLSQPLGNGPVELEFLDVKPLKYVQHAVNAAGRVERELTGYVDDLCLDVLACDTDSTILAETICSGDTLLFGDLSVTQPGLYIQELTNDCAGDSIVLLTVETTDVSSENYTAAICPDETVVILGETFDTNNTSGSIVLDGANQFGCDSIVNIQITILSGPECDPVSIPTLSEWGAIVLLLLISILAVVGIRNERLVIN